MASDLTGGFNKYFVQISIRRWTRNAGVASNRALFLISKQINKIKIAAGSLPSQFLTVNPTVHRLCWLCVSLSPTPRSVGHFYLVSPQSLELETGVSHYSLDLLITARLRTRSSAAAFCLPTPPSPHICLKFFFYF